MPLNDNGFTMPEDADILANQEQLIKEQWGNDIDTSPGAWFGRLARYEAYNVKQFYEKEQQTYDGSNPDTATGIQLDRQARNAGIQRNAPQYATAQLKISGTPGYIVPEMTDFETQNGDVFSTLGSLQLGNDGKGQIMAVSQQAAASENVGANTITLQSEPVDDITDVTNPDPATGGADMETDYDLRNRIRQNNRARPGTTANGLETAILNVNGVQNVHMQNNRSDTVDEYGNPPHSIHLYISGGKSEDIFNALYNNAAYGTTFVGSINENKTVGTSNMYLAYDNASPLNIYFKISLDTTDGYDEDAVKQSVDDYLADFDMGSTIIVNKLYAYLYQLDGIKDVKDIELSTDGKNYSPNDISLQKYQMARINNDDTDIQITTGVSGND